MNNEEIISGIEALLEKMKTENKKFQFSSAFERLQYKVKLLEEELKELKDEIKQGNNR